MDQPLLPHSKITNTQSKVLSSTQSYKKHNAVELYYITWIIALILILLVFIILYVSISKKYGNVDTCNQIPTNCTPTYANAEAISLIEQVINDSGTSAVVVQNYQTDPAQSKADLEDLSVAVSAASATFIAAIPTAIVVPPIPPATTSTTINMQANAIVMKTNWDNLIIALQSQNASTI